MYDWDKIIFKDVGDVGDTILTYPPVCAPATIAAWPGRRMCLWDVNSAELAKRKRFIMGGNSVSHHMLNFAAQILDAEPLILVGSDLGYTKPKTHAEGTYHDFPEEAKKQDVEFQQEAWAPSTGKGDVFHPECHKTEIISGGGLRPIGPVLVRTSPSYMNFRDLFCILIARHGKKVYNSCPNGLKIENAPYLNLASWMV